MEYPHYLDGRSPWQRRNALIPAYPSNLSLRVVVMEIRELVFVLDQANARAACRRVGTDAARFGDGADGCVKQVSP
ncbi:MAG: hypothetical protein ACLP8B_24495 [Xanthobacteraceae bacterium]